MKMQQTDLFGNLEVETLTIMEAAAEAGVSEATIRNWAKTGYLEQVRSAAIEKKSLATFMEKVAGKDKLRNRANKQFRDEHDHHELTERISVALVNENAEHLGAEYEASLSNAYRNKEGIYYTLPCIAKDMLATLEGDITGRTFLDPCCGSGNFLLEAIERGFQPENVYGYDTDHNAVAIARKRVLDRTGHSSRNIRTGDFLEAVVSGQVEAFDHVYTNPPWGKKISKEIRERYCSLFGLGRATDTSSLFLLASLSLLKENGTIGFLLPGSFFNIGAFEEVRRRVLRYPVLRIVDYGKPFKGLLTDAQALIVKNDTLTERTVRCVIGKEESGRTTRSFLSNPRSIMNFWVSGEANSVIEHVFSVEHITLKDRAKWGLGLVTGNNSKFVHQGPGAGLMPVYRGSDIGSKKVKPASVFIPTDLSKYQQVAPLELYMSPEKLIYKFISSYLRFHVDRNQSFMLNSANMLVPTPALPITIDQLCALLNSHFMNWLFQALFRTAKVLRGDLEVLPLHVGYFRIHRSFVEEDYLKFIGIEMHTDGTYRVKG